MLREAVQEDLFELLNLYLSLHEKDIPEDSLHLQQVWSEMISDQHHHVIVKEVEGRIVSSCICVIIPNLTRGVRPYALIENVVTREEDRGKGYASSCLEYAKQIAKEGNCYKMMLLTGSKNASTQNFYKGVGYNSEDKTAYIQWLD
ncbi:Acetyltransferase (GNAT) family protein [Streptococcus mitis]|uniref:Acetyltransferase (GNAT) family protein n=1 Tax=Streptococcus mitis TaxID=28037 RepID=A0A428EFS0_STRMT|nr:GNAT family N-acetyltransferase [Streptococcus mitis]RSI80427.1 Acetyltransferase (GNAT) family protein [Streptococcus mitis]RSJ08963.1 Acetyltransferase (GNAT) family protein [Streptococcus mitis]